MNISFLTIISLAISYLTIYAVVYFTYIYFYKSKDKEHTLFHPNISMIIPAYNEENNIKKCINSLINQEYNGRIEIIVIDDGSTDKTRRILKNYESKRLIKLILKNKPGKPTGKISSINLGVKIAKNSIVGVLDADSYLNSKAIKNMIGEFENSEVGAVVPIVKVHKPKKFLERMQVIEYTLSMCVRKLASNTGSLFLTHGVGTLFRKKALREVNYFEDNTLTEDLNIGLKLIKKGYRIRSLFNAIGYTVVPDQTSGVIKQRLRWNGGLFENSYWFKDLLLNKKYGNTGLFILPMNLMWSGVTVYVAINWIKDSIKDLYYDVKDLIITNFDWHYFISNKLTDLMKINITELTILSVISTIMFISFYTLMNHKIKINLKESFISYLLLPFYFSIFFLLNAISIILTPIYLIKRGGKPWLSDKKD